VGFGHSLLALTNLHTGLHEISLNEEALRADLHANWGVLAEALQTVMRAEIVRGNSQVTDPYALVKELTRGHAVDAQALAAFVEGLDISEEAKKRLAELTPELYVGLASDLVDYLD
jgi:adenylosuccinate lyase